MSSRISSSHHSIGKWWICTQIAALDNFAVTGWKFGCQGKSWSTSPFTVQDHRTESTALLHGSCNEREKTHLENPWSELLPIVSIGSIKPTWYFPKNFVINLLMITETEAFNLSKAGPWIRGDVSGWSLSSRATESQLRPDCGVLGWAVIFTGTIEESLAQTHFNSNFFHQKQQNTNKQN